MERLGMGTNGSWWQKLPDGGGIMCSQPQAPPAGSSVYVEEQMWPGLTHGHFSTTVTQALHLLSTCAGQGGGICSAFLELQHRTHPHDTWEINPR